MGLVQAESQQCSFPGGEAGQQAKRNLALHLPPGAATADRKKLSVPRTELISSHGPQAERGPGPGGYVWTSVSGSRHCMHEARGRTEDCEERRGWTRESGMQRYTPVGRLLPSHRPYRRFQGPFLPLPVSL